MQSFNLPRNKACIFLPFKRPSNLNWYLANGTKLYNVQNSINRDLLLGAVSPSQLWSHKISAWLRCAPGLNDGMCDDSNSSLQLNVFCLICLQLIMSDTFCHRWMCTIASLQCFVWNPPDFVIGDCVPLLLCKVLFGTHQTFTVLLCINLQTTHRCHSSSFSCGTYFETFWVAEVALVVGSLKPPLRLSP